jgi:pimeloyl-ACP methyl ester carboxylesterase
MSAQTTPRTFITVDQLPVAHAVFGDGDVPLLALHGWGASVDLIAPLASRLAGKGLRVYVPDLPGFGQTPPPPSTWSVHDYANFLLRYLDANRLDRVHLFGHSFGGRLSLVLGAEHPARIQKIVLADSAGVPPRRDPLADARLRLYKGVRDGLKNVGLSGLSEQLRGWYNQQYGSADFKSAGVLRDTFVKVVNENLLPYAARIKAPTLMIWGADDEDTPLWQAQQLEKTIPDAGLVVYENAGHYSYLDKLPEVVKTLEYFYTT